MENSDNLILQYEQSGAFDDDLPEPEDSIYDNLCCPNCGGLNYSRYPIKNIAHLQYKEFICNDCGYHFSEV